VCQIYAVRTTLNLEDELLRALMARHPDLSKTEAIETAIRTYLADSAAARLRRLAGTVDIEDVSKELRKVDRSA
jgi:hypothetical protein